MTIHGRVVMIGLPGGSMNSRSGPGEEVAPSPTAATRSSNPTAFQARTNPRARPPARAAIQATGPAVAPTKMSPHPATGAKGAGSRCMEWSSRNETPRTRKP